LSSTASADSTSPEARRRQMQAFFARADVRQMSQGLEEFAQAVAVVVDDEAVRKRLHERCMERFDGETNVLWNQLNADSRVRGAGGTTASWSERVERVLAVSRSSNGAVRAAGGVQAAVAKFEGITSAPLHLFWMYPSRWDKKTTPLVAFVPFDVDPDTRKSIPAFDSKGNRYELDREGKLAKERPVAVITFNERTNLDGKVRIDKLIASGSHETPAASLKFNNKSQMPSSDMIASGCTAKIRLDFVHIEFYGDELSWDGAAEFEYNYTLSVYHPFNNYQSSYDYGRTYIGWNATQFYPATLNTACFSQSAYVPQSGLFQYYEDDGAGLWNFLDDFMGQHIIALPKGNGVVENLGASGFVMSARYTHLN